MSQKRLKLQALLVSVLGSPYAYFQPPPKVKMEYPCIVYRRVLASEKRADNLLYGRRQGYTMIFISPDPDDEIIEKLYRLPMCSFERHYTADNLNHDVFRIFF